MGIMKGDARNPYILKIIILEDINKDHRMQVCVFVNLGACCVPGTLGIATQSFVITTL